VVAGGRTLAARRATIYEEYGPRAGGVGKE
jgi:hypothetical protein